MHIISTSLTAGPVDCVPLAGKYTVLDTILLTEAGTATVTDGATSTTIAITVSTTSVAYSLTGLTSGSNSHTVTVSLPGCGTTTATYTAPAYWLCPAGNCYPTTATKN